MLEQVFIKRVGYVHIILDVIMIMLKMSFICTFQWFLETIGFSTFSQSVSIEENEPIWHDMYMCMYGFCWLMETGFYENRIYEPYFERSFIHLMNSRCISNTCHSTFYAMACLENRFAFDPVTLCHFCAGFCHSVHYSISVARDLYVWFQTKRSWQVNMEKMIWLKFVVFFIHTCL